MAERNYSNPYEELTALRKRASELERKIGSCNHDWMGPIEELVDEEIQEQKAQGSDIYWAGTGSYRKVPKWKRVCKKCGKVEVTGRTEEVTHTTRRPKF